MLLARRWAGALVVEDTVFVIGGIGGKGGTYEKRLDSVESLELCLVEVYDPKKNVWRSRLLGCAIEYR